MSSSPGIPTLDQLRIFLTIVDAGSFAGAARKLGRATSVISYSVANLEAQLGVSLFDRESTRKPQLTEAGRMVLAEARTVSNGVDGLRAKVRGLLQGLEAEIHLVLDVMLPAWRVVDALKEFRAEFPTVHLRLNVEALGAVTQMVLNRSASIGVGLPLDAEIAGIERIGVGSVELVPVAAPNHPLARAGQNAPGAGRDHIQLVLTDRSPFTQGQEMAVVATQTLRLADLGSKHMLLREGIGWGNMPEPMVREDLAAGRLVPLDMPDCRGGSYRLQAIYRTDTPPGPAGSWLIKRFQEQAESPTARADENAARFLAGGRPRTIKAAE
ncbi:LysR family transcriptional regulator [Microvirga sp. GCM10011540]|uniref:LysR family transcriptional regulator n=1 Tax=Microvirga sp. GCM10011540 TaxID=3317338 RepID=UPI00362305EE